MRKTIAVIVENQPGVLTHVSALISRRGYNIESIAASGTEKADITRISIVVEVEEEDQLGQIMAQLQKLVQTIKVLDMTNSDCLYKELALIKVHADASNRQEVLGMVEVFKARPVDVHPDTMIIEITDNAITINTFCEIMEKYGIIEIIRTGEVFMDKNGHSYQ